MGFRNVQLQLKRLKFFTSHIIVRKWLRFLKILLYTSIPSHSHRIYFLNGKKLAIVLVIDATNCTDPLCNISDS